MTERIVTAAFVRIWLGTLAIFFGFGVTLLAVPLYARDELAARDVAIGLAVGAASVSAVLASPTSGRLADRHGRRLLLVAGAAIMLACYLALLLGPPLPALAAIRFVSERARPPSSSPPSPSSPTSRPKDAAARR